MRRKIPFFLIALICLILTTSAIITASSGDAGLDGTVAELNLFAQKDFGQYKTNVCFSYNLTESKFDYFYFQLKMAPADIVMTFEVATAAKVPVEKVVTVYQDNKGKGWGVIAKELGIKPGSAGFHALKAKLSGQTEKLKHNKPKGQGKGKWK